MAIDVGLRSLAGSLQVSHDADMPARPAGQSHPRMQASLGAEAWDVDILQDCTGQPADQQTAVRVFMRARVRISLAAQACVVVRGPCHAMQIRAYCDCCAQPAVRVYGSEFINRSCETLCTGLRCT